MTPAAKIVYSLALLIGFSVGTFFGYWRDIDLVKAYYAGRQILAPDALDDFSFTQYRHADADHAKLALLSFADLLEKLEAVSPDKNEQRKLAETYTRLALLEDSANNAQASRDYMAMAQHWNTASGNRYISDSEMKAKLIYGEARLEDIGLR